MIATVAAVAAHPGHPGHWGMAPFWPFFIIGPLMFLVIVGLLIALLVRRRRWGGPGPWAWHGAQGTPGAQAPWAGMAQQGGAAQSRTAEQILADRFAKGDVDETEYRARLEVLRANRPEA